MNSTKIDKLITDYPLVKNLINLEEVTWFNPQATTLEKGLPYVGLSQQDVADAEARLQRFAPYLCQAFPETQKQRVLSSRTLWLSLPCRMPCNSAMGWR